MAAEGGHPSLRQWIDRLFFWDKDHCKECYFIEIERRQLPREYSERFNVS
jgi:hypothetical protein